MTDQQMAQNAVIVMAVLSNNLVIRLTKNYQIMPIQKVTCQIESGNNNEVCNHKQCWALDLEFVHK